MLWIRDVTDLHTKWANLSIQDFVGWSESYDSKFSMYFIDHFYESESKASSVDTDLALKFDIHKTYLF